MTQDLLWSYAGTGVFAISGLAIFSGIAIFYGAEGLGVFNQVYAIFVIVAQFAGAGGYESALRSVAASNGSDPEKQAIALVASLASVTVAIPIAVVFWFAAPLVSAALGSDAVLIGLRAASFAFPFVAINNAMFGGLNGGRHIKALALSSSIRYLGLAAILLLLGLGGATFAKLPIAFVWAEVVVLPILLIQHRKGFAYIMGQHLGSKIRGHWRFGLRAAFGSALIELNPRIDVIMVGVFMSDASVGIYSFVSLLAEGLLRLLTMLRVNVNPMLVPLFQRADQAAIQALLSRIKRLVYPTAAGVTVAVVLLFPLLIAILNLESEFLLGRPVLTVFCAGIFLASGYAAFGQSLNQAGLPAYQSFATLVPVIVNIVFCALLIPVLGIVGAAVSAVLALILQLALVFGVLRWKLGLRLL